MNTFVTAIVVSHDADDYLTVTNKALAAQTRQPDSIVVIEPSSFADLGVAIAAALPSEVPADSWFWLLQDDTAPDPTALAELVAAVELSPSVAIAGPKLVRWQQPRIINQMGLTLTPAGAPFSPIDEQFDQGQHDDIDDVMAVGFAAALIRRDVFNQLGGFDRRAPIVAADLDFSIRTRLSGHRVIVVPKARVQHAELSLNGMRKRAWLGTSPKLALRRAAIHLRFEFGAMALIPLFWLALPMIGILRAVMQVARKRPELISVEVAAALWGFFTVLRRVGSRGKVAQSKSLSLRELRSLRASRAEVRAHNRADLEREEAFENLSAFERGDGGLLTGEVSRGFFATGGVWWMLALAAASFQWWPKDLVVTAKGVIPLSASWWDVFMRAGASYQPIGLGFFVPSDPFAWVLTAIAGLTFWAPSLSIAILLFLVKPLAFLGAWKLVAQISNATWVRVAAGLAFAFWPALQLAQNDGRLPSLIAGLALPWLIIALVRVAQIGRITKSSAQSWTWVATAGLLTAIIGASAPNLIPLILSGLILLALVRIRRLGYLVWVGLPSVAIFGPTVLYYCVGLAHPLALLADPGLAVPSAKPPFLSFFGLAVSALVLVVAAFSLLRKRLGLALVTWLALLVALIAAYFAASIDFPAMGVGQAALEKVNGSPAALLIFVGLALVSLVSLAVDGIPNRSARRIIAAATVALTVLPGVSLAAMASPVVKYSDGRVVPSIVAAEADQGSHLSLLVLTPSTDSAGNKRLAAELVAGDGVHLDDLSLAYRFSIASIAKQKYGQVSQLVADLVSANGTPMNVRLQGQHIGYVLVPSGSSADISELGIALDSVSELETVGLTDFGRLWRVREAKQPDVKDPSSHWSVTKGIQVVILLGFVLMAVPSRTTRRRGEQQIFIESGEDAQ